MSAVDVVVAHSQFPFFELVLGFFAIEFLLELYLDTRQYFCYLINEVPHELQGLVEYSRFQASQSYGRDKAHFHFASSIWNTCLSLYMLWSGFWKIWLWAGDILAYAGYDSEYQLCQSLVFFVLYQLVVLPLGVPWSLYFQFVIEERHGFNKMTLSLFFSDLVRSAAVGVVIGLPFLAGLLKLISVGGVYFYIYAWVFVFLVSVVLMVIYPIVIAPLFNKFTPIVDGEIHGKIKELADRVHYPLTALFEVDGSIRSSHSNAYLYGFFKSKRIVLYDTLIKQVDTQGITAVVAHELGHWHHNHTLKGFALSQVILFGTLYLSSHFIYNHDMYRAFGFEADAIILGLLCFSQLYSPVDRFVGLLSNSISRAYEYQADAYAASLGFADPLKNALVALQLENLSAMIVDPWYSVMNLTHPHITERLNALDTLKKS